MWSWRCATICNFLYDVTELPIEINVNAHLTFSIFFHSTDKITCKQDLLALKEDYTMRPAMEETINDPTNSKHYWRYRMCIRPLHCFSIPPFPAHLKKKKHKSELFLYICSLIRLSFNQVLNSSRQKKAWGVQHVIEKSFPTSFTLLDPLSTQLDQF